MIGGEGDGVKGGRIQLRLGRGRGEESWKPEEGPLGALASRRPAYLALPVSRGRRSKLAGGTPALPGGVCRTLLLRHRLCYLLQLAGLGRAGHHAIAHAVAGGDLRGV